MAEAVAIVLAYLWGALPMAYLVARLRYGVDIRRYGSGNVGASNYMRQIGPRTGLAVGLFDGFAKGALPIALANAAGVSLWGQVGLSLAAVIGHNWSPYIRFTGGRGVASAMGAYVGFGLWPQLLVGIIVVGLIGWLLLRNLALWMVLGMSLMVPLSLLLPGQPIEITAVLLGLILLVLAKRLTSNGERPVEGVGRLRLVLNRLLYDRDVAQRDDWVVRKPEESRPGQRE